MARFAKLGLREALLDLGVDLDAGLLDFEEIAQASVQLADLQFNYEPALKGYGRAWVQSPVAATEYNVAQFQAPSCGLWLMKFRKLGGSASSATTQLSIDTFRPFTPTFVSDINWNITGGVNGETYHAAGANIAVDGWFPVNGGVAGTTTVAARGWGSRYTALCTDQLNIWVPGLSWVTFQDDAVNLAFHVSFDVQFPAQSLGKFGRAGTQ